MMNENFDLVIAAFKNPAFKCTMLVFEKVSTESSLLVLTTKWRESVKKIIPAEAATIYVNDGNLLLLHPECNESQFALDISALDNKDFKTTLINISEKEVFDILLKITD